MNHYDTLEVSSKASPAVIKAAYKSLVQRYHPDKNNNDSDSAQRTAQIVQAYEVLSDETRRASYDQQLQSQATPREMPLPQAASSAYRAAAIARTKAQPEGQGYWVVWLLIIATIILALWFLLRPGKPVGTAPRIEHSSSGAGVRADPMASGAQNNPALGNRLVMLELSVSLADTDKLTPGSIRILKIPILHLDIAHPDAKKLLWHLDDRKEPLRKNIELKLSSAVSAQLGPDSGPKYVRELIWQTLSEMAAAQSPELAAQAYNMEVELPKGFTAGEYAKTQMQAAPIQ